MFFICIRIQKKARIQLAEKIFGLINWGNLLSLEYKYKKECVVCEFKMEGFKIKKHMCKKTTDNIIFKVEDYENVLKNGFVI